MLEAEQAVRKTVRDIRRSRGRPDRDGRSMEHRHLYFPASRPFEIALRKDIAAHVLYYCEHCKYVGKTQKPCLHLRHLCVHVGVLSRSSH
jgi:hypothetical protein